MSQPDLEQVESRTLGHYSDNAAAFFRGTIDHDVSQNRDALLNALPAGKPLDLLDFGCGPGRDLKAFSSIGHRAVGLDGCARFCEMAREYSGCEVLHQSFLDLNLAPGSFDGVFANASLFHVPGMELGQVLQRLHQALRPAGILFMSNPRGDGEGWSGNRYGHYMELPQTRSVLEAAGFRVVDHYYRPAGKPIEQQPWLAVLSERGE